MLQENPSDPLNTALMMADKKRSKAISRQLKKEGKLEQKYIKLLLLGPGEAGKSTLIRQMQLIHGEPLDLQWVAYISGAKFNPFHNLVECHLYSFMSALENNNCWNKRTQSNWSCLSIDDSNLIEILYNFLERRKKKSNTSDRISSIVWW